MKVLIKILYEGSVEFSFANSLILKIRLYFYNYYIERSLSELFAPFDIFGC